MFPNGGEHLAGRLAVGAESVDHQRDEMKAGLIGHIPVTFVFEWFIGCSSATGRELGGENTLFGFERAGDGDIDDGGWFGGVLQAVNTEKDEIDAAVRVTGETVNLAARVKKAKRTLSGEAVDDAVVG